MRGPPEAKRYVEVNLWIVRGLLRDSTRIVSEK